MVGPSYQSGPMQTVFVPMSPAAGMSESEASTVRVVLKPADPCLAKGN